MPSTSVPTLSRRSRIRAVTLTLPVLALTVAGLDLAAASTSTTPYVAQNSGSGAVVTTPSGASHKNVFPLRAVAPDGTAQLLTAKVTPSRTAPVVVDATTGVARILAPATIDASTQVYAGSKTLVLRRGSTFRSVEARTGRTTALAGIPAAAAGATRQVTAVAATSAGALVATVDATDPGSSGQLYDARVWRLGPTGATQLHAQSGAHIPALAATGDRVDALLMSTADDRLTHRRIAGGTTSDTPVTDTLPLNTVSVDLGYGADATTPVLTLTTSSGVKVLRLDGATLRSAKAGSRVFTSATDVRDPRSVANRLSTTAALSGVPKGTVSYGRKITPRVSATATGPVPASGVTATLSSTRAGKKVAVTSGKAVTLSANSCFTASAPATLFTAAATPVTQCVNVQHRLTRTAFSQRTRNVTVVTTAAKVRIDVARSGRWVAHRTVKAPKSGRVTFRAPAGTVRVVAIADTARASATLKVTSR